MAIYAVTFRVHYDGGYEARYESLVTSIRGHAEGEASYWDEPTSFFLMRSSMAPAQLADSIIAASDFDSGKDLLLVLYVSGNRGHAIRGHYTDGDVLTLLAERSK